MYDAPHPAADAAACLRRLAQATVATSRAIVDDARTRVAAARATRAASLQIVASRRPPTLRDPDPPA